MHIKTVSVTYSRKIGLPNYSSAEAGVTLWADVGIEEDVASVMADLWTMAKRNVRAATAADRGVPEEAKSIYLGNPARQPKAEPESQTGT